MYLSNKIKIIAEIGVNHNGSLYLAKKLIKKAKECGADYVKFQLFNPNEMSTIYNKKTAYQIRSTNKNENQFAMLNRLHLSEKKILNIYKFCKKIKINFLASIFDIRSLNFIKKLEVDYIKIPSGEITNYQLLKEASKVKKTFLLSTGMSTYEEIMKACKIFKKNTVVPFYCVSSYPTKIAEINFKKMLKIKKIKKKFGYSDHTMGIETAIVAVSHGATFLEKHLTLNKKMNGPDHSSSSNVKEFNLYVKSIRNAEIILYNKQILKNELANVNLVRKFLVAKKNIKKNDIFTLKNVSAKRCGGGISPMFFNKILGKKAKKSFFKDEIIKL